jgi:hypothetical protein
MMFFILGALVAAIATANDNGWRGVCKCGKGRA